MWKSLIKKNHYLQRGFSALLVILLLTFVFISLAGVMASVVMVSKRQYATHLGARKAYYGAESFINSKLYWMAVDPNFTEYHFDDYFGDERVVIDMVNREVTVSQIGTKAKRTLEVTKDTKLSVLGVHNVVIMLDCSGSMYSNRGMEYSIQGIKEFVGPLRDDDRFGYFRRDGKLGFWAFSTNVKNQLGYLGEGDLPNATEANLTSLTTMISNWTEKSNSCRCGGDSCVSGDTNTGGGAGEAAFVLQDQEKGRVVILFTDGEANNAVFNRWGCSDNCSSQDECKDEAVALINCVTDVIKTWDNFEVYVILYNGVSDGSSIDRAYRNLAEATGGRYIKTGDPEDIVDIFAEIRDEVFKEIFTLHEIEPKAEE